MTTVFKLADKVAAFKDKLKSWEQRVNKRVFDKFQTLAEALKGSEPELSRKVLRPCNQSLACSFTRV